MMEQNAPPTPEKRGPGRPVGDPQSVRRALLESGRETFAMMGFGPATARDIVGRAGCTAPALYHHYGNKAGLFVAVMEDVNAHVIGAFERAVAGRPTLRDRIEAVLDETVRMQEEAPTIGRFVVAAPLELTRHPELHVAAEEMGRLGRFIEDMCADGAGVSVPPRQVEYVVQTLIYGLSRMAAAPRSIEYVGAVDALKTLLRGTLFTDDEKSTR